MPENSVDQTDMSLFPTLYKLNQASDLINHLRIKLMKHFGWKRVATIKQDNIHVKDIDNFHFLMRTNNMTLVTASDVVDMTIIPNIITTIKNFDARIIFGSLSSYVANYIFCEAFKQGLYGQRYVWILTGLESGLDLFRTNDCTLEEVEIAAHGHFELRLNRLLVSSSPEPTITGRTSKEEVANLETKFFNSTFDMPLYGPVMLDTVWALALGLNNSIKNLNKQGKSLDNYSYSYQNLAAIMKGMKEVAFRGVTGPVSFDKFHNRNRIGTLNVTQHFASSTRDIAFYDCRKDSLHWFLPLNSIWKDNFIPSDSGRIINKERLIPKPLYFTLCALAGVGILFTIACFVFNVVWRKHRTVKMSSPNINSIILIGCLLIYVTIVIKTAASATKATCAVQLFCFWIGFTTTFGSMLSKTWRVYRIFTNEKMKLNMSIRDTHLLVIIGIVVAMETIVLIVWQCLSPHLVTRQLLDREHMTTDSGDELFMFYPVCQSEHSYHFNWTLRIMNGTLIAFGAFLAWETRHVHIDALNDSKTIGICVYNVVILSAVELLLSLVLQDKPVVLLGVTSVCLFAGTLASEMLIFLPKMLAVYKISTATPQTAVITIETIHNERSNTAH
ncbi:gamma-aminobutyric acid type B receptor subunit 2-like [Dreissena polymorpha]|nr:gamma-aminobutyric acid type B receptor subunit 2-like [Dreissena polymorpha]